LPRRWVPALRALPRDWMISELSMSEPRVLLAVCLHALVTGSALWLIATAELPLPIRIVAGFVTAAILLPWLQTLAAGRLHRLTLLALLLVVVIGAGIVEVLASAAHWPAVLLLGAAMLEFAVLISLTRDVRAQASNEPAQQ